MHHEDVDAADVLEQLEVDFAIGEALQLGLADGDADVPSDLFGEGAICRAGEELEALVLAQIAGALALGRRLALLALRRSGPRRRPWQSWRECLYGLPSLPGSGVSGCCFSSAVIVAASTFIFPRTSKLVLAPRTKTCSWGPCFGCSTASYKKLAGRLGFEPRQVPPKGTVLPLDDRPTARIPIASCDPPADSRLRVSLAENGAVNPVSCSPILTRAFHPSSRCAEWCGSTSIAP